MGLNRGDIKLFPLAWVFGMRGRSLKISGQLFRAKMFVLNHPEDSESLKFPTHESCEHLVADSFKETDRF